MSDNVTVAIVSASGAVVVAVAALFANTFWIGKAIGLLESKMDTRMTAIERRLDLMESDLKQFYKDIIQIKQKIGID